MKKILIILSVTAILVLRCATKSSPTSGIDYGKIQNPSAEITEGSVVNGWNYDTKARNVIHFYDNVAKKWY